MLVNNDSPFSIRTEQFEGPIDLLLYLVRRYEVEITEIALSEITQKYFEFIDVLGEIEIDSVGDFIEIASLLVEIKSRRVLPRNEFETDVEEADPRLDLVERLLTYKKYKDASVLLEDHQSRWADRYSRMADDAPTTKVDPASQPIREVELWDLVSAFGRVLRDNRPVPKENIIYDETPIQVYMKRIHERIVERRQVTFTELFEPGMHKSAMVGVFLAVLELARYHNVRTDQNDLHSEITMVPADGFKEVLEVHTVDDYNPHASNLKPGDPSSLIQ